MNETKSWFFEKINKINKSLANLTKRRTKSQINEIRHEKESTTTNTNEIHLISGRNILKTCIQINWKIQKEWINF
jgi:transcriptional regulator of met regulon